MGQRPSSIDTIAHEVLETFINIATGRAVIVIVIPPSLSSLRVSPDIRTPYSLCEILEKLIVVLATRV